MIFMAKVKRKSKGIALGDKMVILVILMLTNSRQLVSISRYSLSCFLPKRDFSKGSNLSLSLPYEVEIEYIPLLY